ncbi:MAG: hypothetical protein J5651_08245 [Salinivirgaceae bacterium]|nr:hypothetical protein [Salinivirgaceae bacterium]MBO7595360.1 hypothetical protein [Salinivirgaceae bacterium]
MKKIFSTLMLIALSAIVTTGAMAQNSFNYQAVIREGGKVLVNKTVNLRLSVMLDDIVYYSEQHAATTNAYGNVSVSVGEGTPLTGRFGDIPWESMRVMMQVEASTDGTDNYTNMGSMQIQPVPYTMYAARVSVIQPAEASDEPIFQVKDNAGNLLFAVYETGVKVFVDDDKNNDDNLKAAKSKFSVAGLTESKGEKNILTIDAGGTTVFVDDNTNDNANKAAKSRFAVAGRSDEKGQGNLLTIDGSGSTIYVDGKGKAAKSKFAVAALSESKTAGKNYSIDGDGSTVYVDFNDNASKAASQMLTIDGAQATFYVDDTEEGKAAKSKFAIAGLSADKSVETAFVIDGTGTLIYIDDINSNAEGANRFVVAGLTANNGSGANNDKFFTINRDSTRIYINDEPVAADTAGTQPGSVPVATPSLASTFAIVGMTQNRDLFTVNKDSAVVGTGVYATEEVQSTAGGVEKLIDDSKASKYYSTGKIDLQVAKMEGEKPIRLGTAEITYAYYRSDAGEYLYLDNQWGDDYHEYRNYWIADGKIYKDTTFVFSAERGLEPISDSDLTESEAEDFTPADWNGKDLHVILESKMKKSGYNALNPDGFNHYYSAEDNEEVMLARRNVVTSLSDAGVFSDNLTDFKTLLNSLYTISASECNLLEDSITELTWRGWNIDDDGSYGYILIDDEIEEGNIIEKEKLQHRIDTTPKTEAEIYAQEPSLLCKHTLAEIEARFSAIKTRHSVRVAVSDKNSGTVTVEYGNNTRTNTSVNITRQYYQKITIAVTVNNDNYVFTGWSDGNKENPRDILVMDNINLTANIVKMCTVNIQPSQEGCVIIECNGEKDTCSASNIQKIYLAGTTLTLTAVPNEGVGFLQWNDSNTDNPRTITVSESNTYSAIFDKMTVVGKPGEYNGQIDVNIITNHDLTYNLTLENVNRVKQTNCSGLILYNKNPGTVLTVNITLVGDNSIVGDNHGGFKLSGGGYEGFVGGTVNVVFDTESTATFYFRGYSEHDFQVETIAGYTISIAKGCTFSGTTNGETEPIEDVTEFFEKAKNYTGGSTFTITRGQ